MSYDNLALMYYLDSFAAKVDEGAQPFDSQESPHINSLGFFFQSKLAKQSDLFQKLEEKIAIIINIGNISSNKNDEATKDFFIEFYKNHRDITIAYGVVLYRIKQDLKFFQEADLTLEQKNQLKEKIALELADRMIVARLLSVILPREHNRYIRDLRNLGQKLYDICGYDIHEKNGLVDIAGPGICANEISAFIGAAKNDVLTVENNLFRLFLIRLRRVVLQLAAILTRFKEYLSTINILENGGLRIIFTYIIPLWFVPRLIFNMYLTGAALYGTSDYSALELSFGYWVRFNALMSLIWGEIVNDLMWVSSGIVGCILSFGAYAFVLPYIAVVAQVYDFITSIVRYHFDTQRLEKMIKVYNGIKHQGKTVESQIVAVDSDSQKKIAIEDLKARLAIDRRSLGYAMLNFLILMSMTVLLLPVFGTISPIIPLVAGIVAVLVTMWHFRNTRYFNQERNRLYGGNLISADSCAMLVCNSEGVKLLESGLPDVKALPLGVHVNGFLRIISEAPNANKLYYVDLKNASNPCQEVVSCVNDFISEFDKRVNDSLYNNSMGKYTNRRAKTLSSSGFDGLCNELELQTIDGSAIKKPSGDSDLRKSVLSIFAFA